MADLIISLGGSIIVPDKIDIDFLKRFREIIISYINRGNRVFIITGGGSVCREYIRAAGLIHETAQEDLDLIGIRATKLNAELLRSIFGDLACRSIVENPTEKITSSKKVIIGSGWKPGYSSDYDAVLIAENLGIRNIVNMTNIDHVYDKNPEEHEDARPIERMSWARMKDIVGDKWAPGMNAPFDPVATKLASVLKLKVVVLNGTDLDNFRLFLDEKEFQGTVVED